MPRGRSSLPLCQKDYLNPNATVASTSAPTENRRLPDLDLFNRVFLSGGVRGQTNFVNVMEDVPKYMVAEQGLAESEAIESRMQENRKEFVEQGNQLYAKA